MATKKPAKTATTTQIQLPNKWVRVYSAGNSRCTECGAHQGKGMMWIDGDVRACRPCGGRIARRSLISA